MGNPSALLLSTESVRPALRDARLVARFGRVSKTLAARPERSFPKAFSTQGELEAAYRFLNNPRVSAEQLLEPHFAATAARAVAAREVVLVHDTTELRFGGSSRREGLGRLSDSGGHAQGFYAHATLAVSTDMERTPLGVLALSTWSRADKRQRGRQRAGHNGEYLRWETQALATDQRLGDDTRSIHVMDREGDCYALLAALSTSAFVIRARRDREVISVDGQVLPMGEAAARAPIWIEREVQLSRRALPPRKAVATPKMHPARPSRMARLGLSVCSVVLRRTKKMPREVPPFLALHVVRVVEIDPPPDASPVEWVLVTNLPVGTSEQVEKVVDCYRARWRIEEYFKALKSGCALEERQLESFHALTNATALFVPIAWQMMALRAIERTAPEEPAARILTPTQLNLLHMLPTVRLPRSPTAREALYAIARMGGHLRHNGAPGWQTLADGFHQLHWIELGWRARDGRCDQ
jgi:hypothetical protein